MRSVGVMLRLVRSLTSFIFLLISRGNLGYGFVNFTTWEGASRLYNSWKRTTSKNCSYNSKKISPAKFQQWQQQHNQSSNNSTTKKPRHNVCGWIKKMGRQFPA